MNKISIEIICFNILLDQQYLFNNKINSFIYKASIYVLLQKLNLFSHQIINHTKLID